MFVRRVLDVVNQSILGCGKSWISRGSLFVWPSRGKFREVLSNLPVLGLVDFALTVCSIGIAVGIIYGTAAMANAGIIGKKSLKIALSLVCPLVTMTQFISPLPVVLAALRKSDEQSLPVPVFQSQSACNILGLSYAIRTENTVVLASNLFGLGCQILFLSAHHFIKAGNEQWMGFATTLVLLFNAMLYTCTKLISINLLGQITTAVNVILFAAPLSKLGSILKTRNATSLPTAMTVISAISNFLWTLYALLIDDLIVLLPSLLGFLLSFFQVIVLLWCFHMLPFDLGFLLLPCKTSPAKSPKKCGLEEEFGLELGEDACKIGKEFPSPIVEHLGSSFETRIRLDHSGGHSGETGGTAW